MLDPQMIPFDPKKPVVTHAGRAARVLTSNLKTDGTTCIAAAVDMDGSERILTFDFAGNCLEHIEQPEAFRLENVPEEFTLWLDVYPGQVVQSYHRRERAERYEKPGMVARVKVTYREGQRDE